jgi:hypothetical protein
MVLPDTSSSKAVKVSGIEPEERLSASEANSDAAAESNVAPPLPAAAAVKFSTKAATFCVAWLACCAIRGIWVSPQIDDEKHLEFSADSPRHLMQIQLWESRFPEMGVFSGF